jgi:hypothetical protein
MGLPEGEKIFPAGGNITFTGIAPGTQVTVTAQTGGLCKLDHWMIDGVRNPSNPNLTPAQTIYMTINSDRTVIAVCETLTTVTLTVTSYDFYLCPIIVSYDGGGGEVSPEATIEFPDIPVNTVVTLSEQTGDCGPVYSWWLDGEFYQEMGSLVVTMDISHTVTAYGGGW